MTLSSQSRQLVYECVSAVLTEELAGLPSKTSQASADSKSIVDALRCAFDTAIRKVSEDWNAAHCDPLISLPTELSTACFRFLDFRGRLAVSHVSRMWRGIALGDCSLWNEYAVPNNALDRAAAPGYSTLDTAPFLDAVSTLLARCDPVAFRFSYTNRRLIIPEPILDVIGANMARMETLCLTDGLERLLHLDAPMLTHLSYTWDRYDDKVFDFPANWGRNAPRLRSLSLDGYRLSVKLPADCLPFVRSLRWPLPPGGIFDTNLYPVFPSLTALHLTRFTQSTLPLLLPWLSSLEVIKLTDPRDDVNCSQLLLDCGAHRIREILFEETLTSLAAVEPFAQSSPGLWTMEVAGDWNLILQDVTCGRVWRMLWHPPIYFTEEPGCAAHFQRLSTLAISIRLFVDLQLVLASIWDRGLPSLHILRLSVSTEDDNVNHLSAFPLVNGEAVRLPALKSVQLWTEEGEHLNPDGPQTYILDWLEEIGHAILPLLIPSNVSGGQRLESIHVRAGVDCCVSRRLLAALLQLSKRVLLGGALEPKTEGAVLVFEQRHLSSAPAMA